MHLGTIFTSKKGTLATVIDYKNAREVICSFQDGSEGTFEIANLRKGSFRSPKEYAAYIGQRCLTNAYGWCTVVEYVDAFNVTVEFDEPKAKVRTEARSVKRGEIRNPLQPDENGFFCGSGLYDSHDWMYQTWSHMKARHFDRNGRNPAYWDVCVCESWKNYQSFAAWCVIQVHKQGWHLDKDLLVKGSREYSPNTCIFLPADVNTFMTKRLSCRGEAPIGVTVHPRDGSINVQYTKDGQHMYLGTYASHEEAFGIYKEAKTLHARELADRYKGVIDSRAYEALMNYEVLITD